MNYYYYTIHSGNYYYTIYSRSRQDFLSERVINYWNNLPNHVKLSTSVDSFKFSLEAYKSANIDNFFGKKPPLELMFYSKNKSINQ